MSRADDLRVGVAIALDEFDLREHVDEAALALALALRTIINEPSKYDEHFLSALADAFDNPAAEYRLRVVRNRRGRPNKANSDADMSRAYFVEWRMQEAGLPLKAAVADTMEQFGCSRATVFRSLKRWREIRAIEVILDTAAGQRVAGK